MKILGKMFLKFLTDTLEKMSQNIFAYFSVSDHSAYFSLLKTFIGFGQGVSPPPFTVRSGTFFILNLP